MRRIYVVFSTEIWKRRNIFRWNLNKCEIFSGEFWKRKNIFRQNMKEEKYFQVTCERWEIFSSKMWKRRNTMAAVGVEEKDGEQAERANDIGLNRRRLHLLLNIGFHKNISSWTLVNITKTLQNIDLTSSRRKTTFLQELVFLKQMWPMKYRLAAFYAAGSELGRLYQYIGSLEN